MEIEAVGRRGRGGALLFGSGISRGAVDQIHDMLGHQLVSPVCSMNGVNEDHLPPDILRGGEEHGDGIERLIK